MVKWQHADRMQVMALEELTTQPRGLWWLSFATEERFLGACVVEAYGIITAVLETHRLKINPGGSVAAWSLPSEPDLSRWANQLLTRRDVGEMDAWLDENYPGGPQGGSRR